MTSRIEEQDLPFEAERYRYILTLQRGTRNDSGPSRKRGRESIDEGQRKRARDEDVILLSSDNDNTKPFLSRTTSGRRASPVSVSSTTDSSESEDKGQADDLQFLPRYVSSDDCQGEDEVTEDEDEDEIDSAMVVEAESSGTTSSFPNKGKGKDVDSQEQLNLQDELECFICCNFLGVKY